MKFVPYKFGDLISSFSRLKPNTTEAPNRELHCFDILRNKFLNSTKNHIDKILSSNQF